MSLSDPNLNSVPQTTDPKAATATKAAKPKVNRRFKIFTSYDIQISLKLIPQVNSACKNHLTKFQSNRTSGLENINGRFI